MIKISSQQTKIETILDALKLHLKTQANDIAYTFLKSDHERFSMTYQELDDRAKMIAQELLKYAAPGDRALMLYPTGLDFIQAFLGCLYAGIIAVPAYPPKRNRNNERILAVASDCAPKLLLCTSKTKQHVTEFAQSVIGSMMVVTDEIHTSVSEFLRTPSSDQLAFLQYTSGSTTLPKGVCVSHRNLVANETMIQEAFGHDKNTIFCGWLPAYHDMGLIGMILQPLFLGIPAILMSPIHFLSKPLRWLQTIDEFRVTSTGAPNFGYEHCLNLIDPHSLTGLDLSCWKVAFNGAEPINKQTLDQFTQAYSSIGFSASSFFPCYGLAEATLFVSGGPYSQSSVISNISRHESHAKVDGGIVSCGQISRELDLKVIDPETLQPLPDQQVGEIWVRGPSVAVGYWNRMVGPDDFGAYYVAQPDITPYFRTGDLGFIEDNELFVTGRIKDLIIIHGRNIYPHDVEQIAKAKLGGAAANSVAAFSVWQHGEEKLCLVMEAPRKLIRLARSKNISKLEADQFRGLLKEIRNDIASQLSIRVEYFAFLPVGAFPRTSSGKVQRWVCKSGLESGELPFLDLPGCINSLREDSRQSVVPCQPFVNA